MSWFTKACLFVFIWWNWASMLKTVWMTEDFSGVTSALRVFVFKTACFALRFPAEDPASYFNSAKNSKIRTEFMNSLKLNCVSHFHTHTPYSSRNYTPANPVSQIQVPAEKSMRKIPWLHIFSICLADPLSHKDLRSPSARFTVHTLTEE